MRSPLSWSTRTKAFALVLVALVLWAPQGVSVQQQPLVTGHSTFFDGDTYDRCLASVAGLLRSRVMWFNDMVLAEHYGGKGTFVYITEEGAPDPSKADVLYSEGVFFDFVDPNGAHWHVEEAYMDMGGDVPTPGGSFFGDAGDYVDNAMDADRKKIHVWFVELSERPISDQFAPPYGDPNYHDLYNFLLLVDTCKFTNNTATYRGQQYHDGTEWGHPVSEGDHAHEGWNANIWIGTRPLVVPAGVSDNTAQWQSQWAANGGAQRDAGRSSSSTANETGLS